MIPTEIREQIKVSTALKPFDVEPNGTLSIQNFIDICVLSLQLLNTFKGPFKIHEVGSEHAL